jgi:polyribonucleotide nucleotidyltransferase
VVKTGDQIMVKVMEIDSQGRINLSRKALLGGSAEGDAPPEDDYVPRGPRPGGNGRGGGGDGGGDRGRGRPRRD